MWTIIENLYNQNIGYSSVEKASSIICRTVELEQDLTDWRKALPENLTIKESSRAFEAPQENTISDRIRTILSLRYHNTRNLLHRPILIKLLGYCGRSQLSAGEEGLYKQMGWSSIKMSLESSREIISLVHAARGRKGLLGAWWFSLYYTFNAALVICAILLVSSEQSRAVTCGPDELSQMRISLSLAVEALQNLDPGNPMVDCCRRYLIRLIDIALARESASSRSVRIQHEQPFLEVDGLMATSQQEEPLMSANHFQDYSMLNLEMNEFMMDDNLNPFNLLMETMTAL